MPTPFNKQSHFSKYIEDKILIDVSDLTKGFLKMLEANRADYIIEYHFCMDGKSEFSISLLW
jgi:hypothetical protein